MFIFFRFIIIIILSFVMLACTRLHDLTNDQVNTYLTLAYYEEQIGNVAVANNYYRKAISASSQSGRAHNNYGVFLCRHGEYRHAIEQLLIAAHDLKYQNRLNAYKNISVCRFNETRRGNFS